MTTAIWKCWAGTVCIQQAAALHAIASLRRFFEQQPLDKVEAGKAGERRLLYWLVEDGVKKR